MRLVGTCRPALWQLPVRQGMSDLGWTEGQSCGKKEYDSENILHSGCGELENG
jgi:hypothetical protein